jgi:hypothetical protein
METPKQKKRNGRSKSFTGGGLASFLRSTVASFSTTFPPSSRNRSSFNHRNALSGPIVSIVPPEARSKRRQPSGLGYRTPEPSSPKVSCIGQVKRCKSKRAAAKANPSCGKNGGACPLPPRPKRGSSSFVKRVLFRRSRSRSSSSRSCKAGLGNGKGIKGVVGVATTAPASAPPPAPAGGLGQMKRFTSGRAAFQDFDWHEAQQTVDHNDDYEEEDEGFVAHSAPLVLGGGVVAAEPKKEVNLWRRRPVAPPTPLQLPY